MKASSVFSFSAVAATLAAASPFKFPLADGFPSPSPDQLAEIEKQAGGALPAGPLPDHLTAEATSILQVIAHGEIFEAAFFESLLNNVSQGVPGYSAECYKPLATAELLDIVNAVQHQEELHALGVNAVLTNSKKTAIKPCEYQFTVESFEEALILANILTDLALASLPGAQALFGSDAGSESGLVPLFGAVIGQEGEQNGLYRFLQKKIPSAAPFLTGGAPTFAWSALQKFIVPGSCPQPLSMINVPILKELDLLTKVPLRPDSQKLDFSIPAADELSSESNSVVYISGLDAPVTQPIEHIQKVSGKTTFTANFPFCDGFAHGLIIAAVVKGTHNFSTVADVAAASINGPALFDVA